jgi:murein DD-endopeptidase MepM/ murein hydrolase activator NlpD
MRNASYRFNPKTLAFEKTEKKLTSRLFYGIGAVAVFAIAAIIILSVVSSHYDTPEMKSLRKENQQLLTQYKNLNSKLSQIETVLDELQTRDDNIYRVILSSDPIPESVRKAGFGGVDKYSELESFNNNELIKSTSQKIDILSKQAYVQSRSYQEVLDLAISKDKELASTPAILPLSSKDISKYSSGWGMRTHPIFKVPRFHYGQDFVATIGTKIYATGDGTVVAVKTEKTGHGRHIIVDHGFGFQTLYAHLSKFNVKPGQKIKRGDMIGFVGSTGTSTAPHLHYEVHKNGKEVNPKYYIFKDMSPDEFNKIMASSAQMGISFD